MQLKYIVDEERVVLRAIYDGAPKIVPTKRLESIFRHGDEDSCIVFDLLHGPYR